MSKKEGTDGVSPMWPLYLFTHFLNCAHYYWMEPFALTWQPAAWTRLQTWPWTPWSTAELYPWIRRSRFDHHSVEMKLITNLFFQVKVAMLKKHRHQFEGIKKQAGENGSSSNMSKLPIIRSLADIGKTHSSTKSKLTHNMWIYYNLETNFYIGKLFWNIWVENRISAFQRKRMLKTWGWSCKVCIA